MSARKKTPTMTPGETARFLGISSRRFWDLVAAGLPRRDDGLFDAAAISQWRAARAATTAAEGSGERSQSEAELARIRVEEARLDLAAKRGELIERDLPQRILLAHTAELISHLNELPDYFVALLPASVPANEKRKLRDACERKVSMIRSLMADQCRRWAAEVRAGRDPFGVGGDAVA